MDSTSLINRNRPQTPQDFGILKAVRYEDAANGVPPPPVASINPPKYSPDQVNVRRPITSPTPGARILGEEKRDSAIAPSLSNTDRASYAESQLSSVAGAAKEPSLPTIVVHDDDPSEPIDKASRSPFARKWSRDKQLKDRPRSAEPSIQRIKSFRGIQSEIPSGNLGDLDLEDLATEKVGFSHRGSLLFRGKKMNGSPTSPSSERPQRKVLTQSPSAASDVVEQDEEEPQHGLVTGPRSPSAATTDTATQNARLLSAEERTFSMRVRSMYEYGDERAAEWVQNLQNSDAPQEAEESLAEAGRATPTGSVEALVVQKDKQSQLDNRSSLRSPTPDVRGSYYREPNELAGGVEDWENVNVQDVDRYGFIIPNRATPGSPRSPKEGLQRVATALRLEADQPRGQRRIRRAPSSATRNSRSVPPTASRRDTARVASVHSVQSGRSVGPLQSANLFRSRDRKAMAGASDMLTLPPGLAEIAEQEDAGRTASMQKKREWAREEKWQKMAQPESPRDRAKAKGGGMRFEFETTDPKLISRTWKGIPDRWRATAWHSFLSASARKRRIGETDEELATRYIQLQEEGSADDVQIDVDVPRTINLHIMFRRRYRGGQRLLFRVLHAISIYFPEVGYVQGMAAIAATLLCYYDEEKAFIMMVRLWQLRGLEQLFQSGFEGLMKALDEFEKDWLRGGDVAQKLNELGITSTAYGTRWYLTLFNMSIPFPAQLRIWDVFMLLGDSADKTTEPFGGAELDVLHATSAALVDATREIILDSDFENVMKVLTSFVPIKDDDMLMRVARAEWKMRKKRGPAKTS